MPHRTINVGFAQLSIYIFFLVIEEEKAESRAEVKSFDKSKLKHVETEEKNPTPTAQTLREELLPDQLPDKSAELKEIEGFDPAKKLKHVETKDKTHLPTKEGLFELNSVYGLELFSFFVISKRSPWKYFPQTFTPLQR